MEALMTNTKRSDSAGQTTYCHFLVNDFCRHAKTAVSKGTTAATGDIYIRDEQ